MKLSVPRVTSKDFTYNAASNMLVSELSTVGDGVAYARLYDDACDTGFEICSARTGAVITVVFVGEKRDNDGDVTVMEYEPTTESIRRVPSCKGLRVHLLND